jgi:hypothetical protein
MDSRCVTRAWTAAVVSASCAASCAPRIDSRRPRVQIHYNDRPDQQTTEMAAMQVGQYVGMQAGRTTYQHNTNHTNRPDNTSNADNHNNIITSRQAQLGTSRQADRQTS